MTKPSSLAASLASVASRLHGIESRTDAEAIAAEVTRINDGVRAGALGRLHSADHPQDFAALLVAEADAPEGGRRP